MKYFLLFVLFFSLSNYAYCIDKITFGSFSYNGELVNYEYKVSASGIIKIKFTLISQDKLTTDILELKRINLLEKQIIDFFTQHRDLIEKETDSSVFNKLNETPLNNFEKDFLLINTYIKELPNSKIDLKDAIGRLEKFNELILSITPLDIEAILPGNFSNEFLDIRMRWQSHFFLLKEVMGLLKDNRKQMIEMEIYESDVDRHLIVFQNMISELFKNRIDSDREKDLFYKIYYEMTNRIMLEDIQPISATVRLVSDRIAVYERNYYNSKNTDIDTQQFLLDLSWVDMEFTDGSIKNVMVYGTRTGGDPRQVKFSNSYPISLTGKFDPEFLRIPIFVDVATNYENVKKEKFINYYLLLSDLIRYDIKLSLYSEDYSPQDTVITIDKTQPNHQLFKSKTSKILSSRTFTDLSGTGEGNPNGLIQLEVYRKFTLWHDYWQNLFFWHSNYLYQGFFSYLTPQFSLTKVEESNKYFEIFYNGGSYNVKALDLLKHKQFDFGLDLNIYNLNIQNYKSKLFVDFHYDLSKSSGKYVGLQNGNDSELEIHTHSFGPTFYYQILPDPRYGLKIGYDIRFQKFFNEQISFSDESAINYRTAWLLGNFRINQTGSELFFRIKYSYLINKKSEDFLQLQLGYAFDIIRNKRY